MDNRIALMQTSVLTQNRGTSTRNENSDRCGCILRVTGSKYCAGNETAPLRQKLRKTAIQDSDLKGLGRLWITLVPNKIFKTICQCRQIGPQYLFRKKLGQQSTLRSAACVDKSWKGEGFRRNHVPGTWGLIPRGVHTSMCIYMLFFYPLIRCSKFIPRPLHHICQALDGNG